MPESSVLVCETTGEWAAALRRWFPRAAAHLREVRTVGDCRLALQAEIPAAIFLELVDRHGLERWDVLSLVVAAAPAARLVVALTDRPLFRPSAMNWERELELAAREAGALAVIRAASELAALDRLVEYVLSLRETRPRRLRDRLWARIPWPDDALLAAPPSH